MVFEGIRIQLKHMLNIQVGGKWTAPTMGVVKVYVDGGVSCSGRRGVVSVICQDASGFYLGASTIVINDLTDLVSLAIACSEFVSLAFDLNKMRVELASDCLEVVKNICDKNPCKYGPMKQMFKRRGRVSSCNSES